MKAILLHVRKQQMKPWLFFHLRPQVSIVLRVIDEIEVALQDGLIKANPS